MLNSTIYQYGLLLQNISIEDLQDIPVIINFYIQKNINKILQEFNHISQMRLNIIQKYGNINQTTQQCEVPFENISLANKELEELFNIDNLDINIINIPLSSLQNSKISSKTLQAILFMIEEDTDIKASSQPRITIEPGLTEEVEIQI